VCHLIKAVNTAGNAGTWPGSHKAEDPTNDPGKGAGLGCSPGGDVVLAVRAHHRHGAVAEAGALHVLHLGHHLHGGLGLHHGLGWWGGTSLLRQGWVHLPRGSWGESCRGWGALARISLSGHCSIVAGRHSRHRLLKLVVFHRRSTHDFLLLSILSIILVCLYLSLHCVAMLLLAGWVGLPGELAVTETRHVDNTLYCRSFQGLY